jgi:hypothetical protein
MVPQESPSPGRRIPLSTRSSRISLRPLTTVPAAQGVWEKGLIANQNSAYKLRNRLTLERLHEVFGLDADG